MHIFHEGPIRNVSRFIFALIPLTILLIPTAIIPLIKTATLRVAVVFIANAIFVLTLSILGRLRIGELFVAGAT